MLQTTQTQKTAPTFESVWATMQESQAQWEIRSAELNRLMKETDKKFQETDRQMKETALQMKETDRKMGHLSNRFGDVVEHLVAPGMVKKFKKLGFTFTDSFRDHEVTDGNGKRVAEIDVELHNGEDIMLIEIKTKPNVEDIDEQTARIELIQGLNKYPGKNVYGAVAAAVFNQNVKNYALKKGLYVIEQSGDTMRIETLGGKFKPKKW